MLFYSFQSEEVPNTGTPLAHSSRVLAQFICQPFGCSFVFNQYNLDAIDIFLCHILSYVSWFTKVKNILDNQERVANKITHLSRLRLGKNTITAYWNFNYMYAVMKVPVCGNAVSCMR